MFTPFVQFMIVVVILFCIAVLIVDRIEVTRHHRLLVEDALYAHMAEVRAELENAKNREMVKSALTMSEEDAINQENERINKILRVL